MRKTILILAILLLFSVPGLGAEWTFMVYLDGDNNLEASGVDDVNEMEMVGSTDQVNILVLFDRARGHDASNGDWTSARVARIVKDNDVRKMSSFDTRLSGTEDWDELNMGDPDTLARFIRFGIRKYPARKYAVILWNHGGGWRDLQLLDDASRGLPVTSDGFQYNADRHVELKMRMERLMSIENSREICSDDSSQDVLFTREVRVAFEKIPEKIHLIGMDACLMGMVEVAYELRKEGEVLVGSQETEPAFGWPYDLLLRPLVQNPKMDAVGLGKVIVESYGEYCARRTHSRPPTQSAIRLSEMDAVGKAINQFVGSLSTNRGRGPDFINIRNRTPAFYRRSYIDYMNFLSLIPEASGIPSQTLRAALGRAIIGNYSYKSEKATGLSVFFPSRADAELNLYKPTQIQFAKDTLWDDFLVYIHKQTPIPQVALPPPAPDKPTVTIDRLIATKSQNGSEPATVVQPGDTVWLKAHCKVSAMPANYKEIIVWGMFDPEGNYLQPFERLQIEDAGDGEWVLINRIEVPKGFAKGKYYPFCDLSVYSSASRKKAAAQKIGLLPVGVDKSSKTNIPRIDRSAFDARKARVENQGKLLIMDGPPSGMRVQLAVNKPGEVPQYNLKDSFKIGIKTSKDAYIALVAGQTDGSFQIIYPNSQKPSPAVRSGEISYFPPKGQGSLFIAPPGGKEHVKVFAASRAFSRQALESYLSGGAFPFSGDWGESLLPIRIVDAKGPVLAKIGGGRDFLQSGNSEGALIDFVYQLQPAGSFPIKMAFNVPGTQPVFQAGQGSIKIGVKPEAGCYLALLHRDSRGKVSILMPSRRAEGNRVFYFPGVNQGALTVAPPYGISEVRAIATLDPLNWGDLNGVYQYLASNPARWTGVSKFYEVR